MEELRYTIITAVLILVWFFWPDEDQYCDIDDVLEEAQKRADFRVDYYTDD